MRMRCVGCMNLRMRGTRRNAHAMHMRDMGVCIVHASYEMRMQCTCAIWEYALRMRHNSAYKYVVNLQFRSRIWKNLLIRRKLVHWMNTNKRVPNKSRIFTGEWECLDSRRLASGAVSNLQGYC
jgi:hypothetical protein